MSRSILELAVGGVPLARRRPTGEWWYRLAVAPDAQPTELDRQNAVDFLTYEEAHGRAVELRGDDRIDASRVTSPPPTRPHPGLAVKQCCSDAYERGCGGLLVCHGTTARAAGDAVRGGSLLAKTASTSLAAADLAKASTWGEPADYFEHVMFANGDCQAPEAVAMSRRVGRDLVPADLESGYPPAVRLYVDWDALCVHERVRFDGVHPAKIEGSLELERHLAAVVVHPSQVEELGALPTWAAERTVVLDMGPSTPSEWASAARVAAEQKR